MKLAGVIVFYNPNEDNVKKYLNYIDNVDKLYIVDNSSKDNKNIIIDKDNKVNYIPLNKNYGIAYALNKGAKTAIEEGYDWLLTMDQDSDLKDKDLKEMIKYVHENDTSKIGIISPWHVINTNIKKPNLEVDYPLEVMTSGNLVNLDIYQRVGGWDDKLFIDDVDIDYCMNLNIHGYQVVRLLYVPMKHSLGNITIRHIWPLKRDYVCSNHNYIRRYYMARNLFYLEQKYYGEFEAYFSFMKRGLKGQMKNIFVFEKDKIRKLKSIKKGIHDGKNNIMGEYNNN